ncbi:hypothetical protein FO519_002891 [Halicephalobus sp. NKZ332]|nr:hypothetical protein FO519_002891 [Halicephalobus sp. NKZ332]
MDSELFKECQEDIQDSDYVIGIGERDYNVKSSQLFLVIAPSIAVISLLTSSVITVLILFAMVKRRLPIRHYIPVVSRTVGDLVVSVMIICISIVANIENAYFAISVISLVISTFGFVQCSLSHILFIVIRQLSHERISIYNEFVKPNTVLACSAFIWMGSFFYSGMFAPMFVALADPLYADQVCKFGSCQSPLTLISIIMIGFLFLACIFFYISVLRKLYMSIKEERSRNELPMSKYKMRKFLGYGGHVALYGLVGILIFVGTVFIYRALDEVEDVLNPRKQCRIVEYMSSINRLQTISGGIVLLWLVRMVFDPVILLANDYRKIVPWASEVGEARQLDEVHSTFSSSQVSESLKWRRHCPITEMEKTISAWDLKD